MNTKPLLVSVDWDFFVQEDPLLDFGHSEQNFFLSLAWALREETLAAQGRKLEDVLPLVGDPEALAVGIAARITTSRNGFPFTLAESHAAIDELFRNGKSYDVINFDAHHDLSYRMQPIELQSLHCGNWAGRMLARGKIGTYTHVLPNWRKKFPEYGYIPELRVTHDDPTLIRLATEGRIRATYKSDFRWPARRRIAAVFVCRSGCWTPPCYDKQFNEFLRVAGLVGPNTADGLPERERPVVTATTKVGNSHVFSAPSAEFALGLKKPIDGAGGLLQPAQ